MKLLVALTLQHNPGSFKVPITFVLKQTDCKNLVVSWLVERLWVFSVDWLSSDSLDHWLACAFEIIDHQFSLTNDVGIFLILWESHRLEGIAVFFLLELQLEFKVFIIRLQRLVCRPELKLTAVKDINWVVVLVIVIKSRNFVAFPESWHAYHLLIVRDLWHTLGVGLAKLSRKLFCQLVFVSLSLVQSKLSAFILLPLALVCIELLTDIV